MNKNEFITRVAQRSGSTEAQTRKVLEAALEQIGETAALGDKVQLPGFGTFSGKDVAERVMRNPQTGEPLVVPATRKPLFKAGTALKAVVAGEQPIRTGRA